MPFRSRFVALLALASTTLWAVDPSAKPSATPTDATSKPLIPPLAPVNGPDRLLAVGDSLRYQVTEDRDAPVELVVSNTGMIDLPYYGPIQAAGRTLDDLRDSIKTALEAELYIRATVRVQVLNFSQGAVNRGRVHLSGQVRRVGPVEINLSERPTLGQTILAAGGLADFGDPRNVRIIRKQADGSTQTIVVDLREVLSKGRIEKDVELQDNDFIIVAERLINW